jgi:hypothetical protein
MLLPLPAFRRERWTEFADGYAARVSTADRFWTRRLRWRLIGAWRWPLFLVLTIVDALIVKWLPPTGSRAMFFPALFLSAFANLFLIGAIAPWLARRMAARQGQQRPPSPTFPPANHLELLTDRIASIVLIVAAAGLLIAGAGNHKVVVAATDRLARGGEAARDFAIAHGPSEDIKRNAREANINSHELEQNGLFRMCIPYDDPTRAYCMYVDAAKKPPGVKPDGDSRPNGAFFPNP